MAETKYRTLIPARDIWIKGRVFTLTKDELIELKEQCNEGILQIRLEDLYVLNTKEEI